MEHHRYEKWLFKMRNQNIWWRKYSNYAGRDGPSMQMLQFKFEVGWKKHGRAIHLVFYANIFLFTLRSNENQKKMKWKLQHSLHLIDNDLKKNKSLSKLCIHIICTVLVLFVWNFFQTNSKRFNIIPHPEDFPLRNKNGGRQKKTSKMNVITISMGFCYLLCSFRI